MDAEQASSLAWHLMIEHDLVRNGWQFRWTNSRVIFGACSHSRRLIKLSLPITLLNPESEVSDTILHEIAHALAGQEAGHGDAWKEQASIGHCFAIVRDSAQSYLWRLGKWSQRITTRRPTIMLR